MSFHRFKCGFRKWAGAFCAGLGFSLLTAGANATETIPISPEKQAMEQAHPLWDRARLEGAFAYARQMGSTTLTIITDGSIVKSLGRTDIIYDVHSVRKAFLSALVGQHTGPGPGQINLDSTLEELGINDSPNPLNKIQRQTRVLDLIRSVSGINHRAAAEGLGGVDLMAKDKARLLGKKTNKPGTVWAYNNWDYNTLTTIFEQETGLSVYDAFKRGIAEPLGFDDFQKKSVYYLKNTKLSQHAKVGFKMSARDMAKFGQLHLNNGKWAGKQLIPAAWIKRITNDFSKTDRTGLKSGHGYLWWVPSDSISKEMRIPAGTYFASGFAGQIIMVLPEWNTVVVHQVSTNHFNGFCRKWLAGKQLSFFQAIAYSRNQCRAPDPLHTEFCQKCRYYSTRDFQKLLVKIIAARTAAR